VGEQVVTVALPSPGDGIAEGIVEAIRERSPLVPVAGIVLGSGLGGAVEVAGRIGGRGEGLEIAFSDLPGFPRPSVPGHVGTLWLGELVGRPVAVFEGRIHFYEGHPMALASLTSRISALLGGRAMVLTAAVGALDPALDAGTLVVLRDHINTMGDNPLRGWRLPDGSPPFVGLAGVYDEELAAAAVAAARAGGPDGPPEAHGTGAPVAEGVYAAVTGPAFETPAECEYLRRIGGTVVGMSMVPEAVVARALGMRVLGLGFVTNVAGASVSHEEVLAASDAAAGAVGRVLVDVLKLI
jgi:purine-nucleoside phosphorylase